MISFGLVTIPIRLYAAARTKRTYLHQIHNAGQHAVEAASFAPRATAWLIVRKSSRVTSMRQASTFWWTARRSRKSPRHLAGPWRSSPFLEQSDVDPIYFDCFHLLALRPKLHAESPTSCCSKPCRTPRKMGVAKVSMHQREYTIFIRARNNGLHSSHHVLPKRNCCCRRLRQEIRHQTKARLKLNSPTNWSRISRLPLSRKPCKDEFQERLNQLIEAKLQGQDRHGGSHKSGKAPVIDMMQALKRA